MDLSNLPLGPELFEKALGPRLGLPVWRVAAVCTIVAFFGGVIYAAIIAYDFTAERLGRPSLVTLQTNLDKAEKKRAHLQGQADYRRLIIQGSDGEGGLRRLIVELKQRQQDEVRASIQKAEAKNLATIKKLQAQIEKIQIAVCGAKVNAGSLTIKKLTMKNNYTYGFDNPPPVVCSPGFLNVDEADIQGNVDVKRAQPVKQ